MSKKKPKLSAREATRKLRDALSRRYKAPEWGLLHEVPNATGYGKQRTADALAMSLWPSRGLHLHGFEIKASRADWLKELKTPGKSAEVQQYCDFWWVVAEKGIVEDGELPPTWGLLERHGSQLRCKREAPKLSIMPVSDEFLAALFRRLAEAQAEWIPRSEISSELTQRYQEGMADGQRISAGEAELAVREATRLQKSIEAFERASGVKITRWNAGDVGAAVKVVLGGDADKIETNLRRLAQQARDIASDIDRRLSE